MSVFSDFTVTRWSIFGSLIAVIAIAIAMLVVTLLEGLGLYPKGVADSVSKDSAGIYWENSGAVVGVAVCSGFMILLGIMGLLGNFFQNRCLTWGGIITSLVLFIFEAVASIYHIELGQRNHTNWLTDHWNQDINDLVTEYYPTHSAAFNQKYGDACPSTYAQSAVTACSSAMSQYIMHQWHTIGLVGIILTAIGIIICIFAIVMHVLAKREYNQRNLFDQRNQEKEWEQAAKKYSGTFADTRTPSTESTDLANKV